MMVETAASEIPGLLLRLGVPVLAAGDHSVRSPIDGSVVARIGLAGADEMSLAIAGAHMAARSWRSVPAPIRGTLVRAFGDELRAAKDALGRLVTLKAEKIVQEGLGEVQEMIDICDLAVGLSRQLHGLTIATERPGHAMRETWHPMGVVGIITAFNFPVAVWSWNAALALVCGNAVVWKPSEKTPLVAQACQALLLRAAERVGNVPAGLSQLVVGGAEAGRALVGDARVSVVSATGSTAMGQAVAPVLATRFARAILELGGNNAMIVAPSADFDLAVRAILFSAVGTAGQRCTTLRRVIVHEDIIDSLMARVSGAYRTVAVGDPRAEGTLVGPLIDGAAFEAMQASLRQARDEGATVEGGERVTVANEVSFYVRPALAWMPSQSALVHRETFAPILYVMRYRTFEEAVALNNAVPQGLASSVFTTDLREAERFMSATGSDCGIVNVKIGPSGAGIGGAFGGEKETGGGREAGSDSWKAYMRRATNTINYSDQLPFAQSLRFGVEV